MRSTTLPVATASTVITNEDTAHTFVTGDFSYTDVEGDALVSVTFNNLNLAGGTLEHSGGTAVTNGMTLTAAQIATPGLHAGELMPTAHRWRPSTLPSTMPMPV